MDHTASGDQLSHRQRGEPPGARLQPQELFLSKAASSGSMRPSSKNGTRGVAVVKRKICKYKYKYMNMIIPSFRDSLTVGPWIDTKVLIHQGFDIIIVPHTLIFLGAILYRIPKILHLILYMNRKYNSILGLVIKKCNRTNNNKQLG